MNKWVRHFLVLLAATAVSATQLQAQATGEIRGFVIDNSMMAPLNDVTITVAGQTVLSAQQGFFVVENVPAGVHTLTANILGYRAFETDVTVTAGTTTDIEVRMAVAPLEMAPIVAVGYGELEAKDQTGVVTEVPAEAFNTGRLVSAEELIQGKVAGVQVVPQSNEPGSRASIRIRGGTSVNASNEPLYVVDGVPLDAGGGLSCDGDVPPTCDLNSGVSPLGFLNPNDISSFTVLKDASATAIYGSRGANGVILIETTAGRARAGTGATVSYIGSFSGSTIASDVDVMNAAQFRTAVEQNAPEKLGMLGTTETDWQKAVQQSAFGQDHTVAVAVGGEKMDLRVSLGYQNQEGIIQRSEFERASLNFAYNQLLFDDRFSLSANVLGSRNAGTTQDISVLGDATNFAPTQPILDATSPFGGYFEWPNPLDNDNPVGALNLIDVEGVGYRSVGNVTGEYQLPKLTGLSVTGRFGYDVTNQEDKFFAPSINKAQDEGGPPPGELRRLTPSQFSWLGDAFLTYVGNWDGGRHGLNVTGGYSYQQWRTDIPGFASRGLSSDLLGIDGLPASEEEQTSLDVFEHKLASWFGRANYTFKDRYIFTATVRTDGSSRFGEGQEWGVFPSFAGAWRMSEESFMDGAGWLSDLRLRVSWGKNGNEPQEDYLQYKDYVFGDQFARARFGDEFISTIRPSSSDPNIKWEETSSWNFGLDYGFKNQRYWGSIEFYTKDTDDLIFTVPVAAGTNLSNTVTTNIGSMKNTGLEVTLNAMFIEGRGDGFTWDANFNAAYNTNELTAINPFLGSGVQQIRVGGISGGVGRNIQVLTPGEQVNSFFVYEHIRDSSGNPIYEDTNEDGTIDNNDLYVDQNNDGIINEDDLRVYNSPAPDWVLGHTSLMRWKSFDFSLTLLAEIGNYVYNNTSSNRGFYDNLTDQSAPRNLHTSVLETNFSKPQYDSDYYVENASYLRLNNIEAGYTFQRALNGVRLYAVAQNLFTLTGYSGIDPTAGREGIDDNIFPRSRTFTAGINVRF